MSAAREDPLPQLRPRENLGHGLQRVMRSCAELVGSNKTPIPDDAAVHRARQALKRARSVLRLAEILDVPRAEAIRRHLAALARKLSPLRDEAVIEHLAWKLESRAKPDVRSALVELQLRETTAPSAAWWVAWRRRLTQEIRAFDQLNWGSVTPARLETALARSAKRVRRWARKARASRSVATLHEWRKAVIAFREQVSVVRPALEGVPVATHDLLHELAHELGRATDLSVLLDTIRGHDWPADLPEAAEKLGAWLQKKQRLAMKRACRDWPALKRELRAAFG